MNPHFSFLQMTFLAGGAVLLGVLVALAAYAIHKTLQSGRSSADLKPHSPRADDEGAFAMATMQGVIATMKRQEKELHELRRAAEQKAEERARISENIIREMPSGLMVFNREGFITVANPAVRTLLGVDTWSKRRYPEILGGSSALVEHIRSCLQDGKTFHRERIEYRTPRGESRLLGISLSPFHAPTGLIEGAVCLLTDLTEIRRLQEQVLLKEHLAALGEMAAGIAHEFKNSLATVSGYAQLLRDSELPPEDRQFAERIVNEIRSLSQVVTDFLALSKPLQFAAKPVDTKQVFCQVMDDLRRVEAFQKVAFHLEGAFPPVAGDDVLLRQAFANLLRNSCEAMAGRENGGDLVVSGEMVRQAERDFLRVAVSDTGGGIPREEQEKIFIPFFTTKPEGSGLGLALVQKILVSHNGSITLENSSPQGTTFAVLLPLSNEPVSERYDTPALLK